MSDERIEVMFGAQIASLLAGLGEASGAVRESVEEMKAEFESLSATINAISAPLIAIGALLAGGEMFEQAIEKTVDLGVQLEVMSQKTGMGVEELSALKYAADLSHVSIEGLSIGLQRLARGMEAAEKGTGPANDAFKALQVNVIAADGSLRPMGDVLLQVAQRFSVMQDGAGKTALAMDLFGRSGASLIPFLNQGAEGIARLEEEAKRLGATMDAEGVSAAVAYEEAMKNLHAEFGGLERTMVLGIVPALSSVAVALTDATHAGEGFKLVGEVIGDVFRVIATSAFAAYTWAREVALALEAIGDAGNRNFVQLGITLAKMKTVLTDGIAEFKALWSAAAEPPKPKTTTEAPPSLDKKDLMQRLETQWLAVREGEREHFGELTQLELSFWQSKLALAEKGSKDYLEIRKKIVALEDQMARTGYEGQLAMLRAKEQADKDDLAAIVADRQAELAIIREHYGEMSKEVQDGIARVDEAQNALTKDTIKDWTAVANAIPKAWNQAMSGIGTNVNSLRDLFRQFFLDLTKMSIEWGAATFAHHVMIEHAKADASWASATEIVAAEAWKNIKSVAMSAWTALKLIGNYAAEAIAATWASISAIPFVGPFLAPAMAAGAGVAILALAGNIHSAAGGFDIPSGVNPMTQLHQQEMVLPAELANRIRGMTGGTSGGDHHFHLHTLDTKTAKQWIRDNGDHLADAMVKAVKDGRSSTRRT